MRGEPLYFKIYVEGVSRLAIYSLDYPGISDLYIGDGIDGMVM